MLMKKSSSGKSKLSDEQKKAIRSIKLVNIRQTLGLLNSMVLSGEQHSKQSVQMVENAIKCLSELEET